MVRPCVLWILFLDSVTILVTNLPRIYSRMSTSVVWLKRLPHLAPPIWQLDDRQLQCLSLWSNPHDLGCVEGGPVRRILLPHSPYLPIHLILWHVWETGRLSRGPVPCMSTILALTLSTGPCTPQLDSEEWIKENPIPYISNDNCSQESIFQYWGGWLQGHAHINQTCPDVVRMSQWRQFHCLPPRGGIGRVFFAAGQQNHALKKNTMNKTLESTLKVSINTKLKFVDLWGQKSLHRWWSHIQETQVSYGVRGLVGDRGRRRWLWCGLTQCL